MLFGSIYQHFTFLPGFIVKNDAVQYRSLRWQKSHEIVIRKDVTNGKSWSSRRFLGEFVGQSWSKSSLDQLIRKEDYVGLPTDSFIGQFRTYDFL